MPQGMCLKSEGFASGLYDPNGEFPLKTYCGENTIAYQDIGLPVHIETFIDYGREFQRRYVPQLERTQINSLAPDTDSFELTTATGEVVRARQVVIATGIMNFAHLPPQLQGIPAAMVSHSSQHSDLTGFKGREVAVLGAGASALDTAMLMQRAGAAVQLIARRNAIQFHDAPVEPRPLIEQLKAPRSGLGTGWRSRMCTDIPMVFHAMPESLRLRIVARHLGPAPCWFVRDEVVGRLPMHLGATLTAVRPQGDKVRVEFTQRGQEKPTDGRRSRRCGDGLPSGGIAFAFHPSVHSVAYPQGRGYADLGPSFRIVGAGALLHRRSGRQQLRAAAALCVWRELRRQAIGAPPGARLRRASLGVVQGIFLDTMNEAPPLIPVAVTAVTLK